MKHTWKIAILSLSAWFSVTGMQAQVEIDNDEDEDVELAGDGGDEIVLPEGMTDAVMDSLLHEWASRNYLTFDEACDPSTENPEFERDVYITRLSHLPNVMEMPYNDVVRKYIDQYATRMRRTVSLMLGASNFYNPIFEEALESYQVPLELKYLPIIESALNPGATSRVGAAGLWQFMITTGKQYGLEVTSLIDERRDPIKASFAAAHYLKDLYDIFGDWTLVIASYNCGPGNVNKAIKRAGGEKDYWAIYKYLPRETQGYVPAFIAANYIMNYYCEHNICPVNSRLPLATDTIMVSKDLHFDQLVEVCHLDKEELKALNPQYRTDLIPGESHACTLKLPTTAINAFLEAGDSIYAYRATELFKNRKEIAAVVAEADSKSTKSKKSKSASTSSGAVKTVTIKNGDTLGAIAARNHTTVAALQRLNNLRGTNIRAGKKLRVK